VHKSNKLAETCAADQINHSIKPWMPVTYFTALNELNPTTEMIDNGLIASGIPPFCCKIVLPPGHDNPEPLVFPDSKVSRKPVSFQVGKMDVAMERR
jgi:hypothetical protein